MKTKEIIEIAEKHGLLLNEEMSFNNMGIDFQVGFAKDRNGQQWVLRLPRRKNLIDQIRTEKNILELVSQYLSIQVPDWKIATDELIAYPLLEGKPALTYDPVSYEVTWHMDKNGECYMDSLAKILVEIHSIPVEEVEKRQLKVLTPDQSRKEMSDRLALVKSELGINQELEKRYLQWLDNDRLWPTFNRFIHGDLYAGHILVFPNGKISGVIDWTTAHVSDIAQDFSGHLTVFGEQSLKSLITAYQQQGGLIWDALYDQAVERAAAAPLAYGFFAISIQDDNHIKAAKTQLGSL